MKNQKGIVWIPILIMVVSVAAFATMAYFIWQKNTGSAQTTNLNKPAVNHVVKNANRNNSTNTNTCVQDSDCKIITSSCDCQAVSTNDLRVNYDDGKICVRNGCSGVDYHLLYKAVCQNQTCKKVAITSATADWKTYTNTAHSFSIQYPPDWITANAGAYGDILLVPPTITNDYQNYLSRGIITLEYQVNGKSSVSSSYADLVNPTTVTINGIRATQGSDPGITDFLATYFPTGNDYIKVIWATALANDTYRQILSTFQFTQ